MYYNVAQLLKEPTGATRIYPVDEPVSIDDGSTTVFAKGQVSLLRFAEGIWVSAGLDVGLPATCSRCLKGFKHSMRITIEEEYLPTADISTGEPLGFGGDDEDSLTIDQRHLLDLTEVLRQYTLANQPLKPLCREDCPGLCPNCGTDLGETPCSCGEGAVDPRWAPILKLAGRGNP